MDNNDFYFEDINPRKAKIIFAVVVVVIIVGIGVFLKLKEKNTFSLKTVTYEAGEKLDYNVEKYLKNKVIDLKDYKISFYGVPTNDDVLETVGVYNYKVKYKNITKTGKIKVVDTTKPEVELNDVTIGADEVLYLGDFIKSSKDYSLPVDVELKNKKDEDIITKVGTHKFIIVISDQAGNKLEKEVKLTVKSGYDSSSIKKNDLELDHTDLGFEITKNDLYVKYKEGIEDAHDLDEDDEYNALANIVTDEHTDLHKYLPDIYNNNLIKEVDIVYAYNKYDYIIGLAFRMKLDNGKVFYITK